MAARHAISYTMTGKKLKRPRDPNQLAKLIADIATGEASDPAETKRTKRARVAGMKGGPARAASLTPERMAEIAKKAAKARWGS